MKIIRVTVSEHTIDADDFMVQRDVTLEVDVPYNPDVAQDLMNRAVQGWVAQHHSIFPPEEVE